MTNLPDENSNDSGNPLPCFSFEEIRADADKDLKDAQRALESVHKLLQKKVGLTFNLKFDGDPKKPTEAEQQN